MAQEIVQKAKLNNGGLPWDAIKNWRTYVGDLMKDPALVSTRNIKSGDLKRLYGALTHDMEQAALQAGPKVHAKWRAANKYFETKLLNDVPIIEEVIKKKLPEEVFDTIMKSSPKGGTRLRALRKNLSKKEWDAVAGTVLGEMGLEKPGAGATRERIFSPGTFLTNWRKMSSQAKRALFKGSRYEGLSKSLDQFVNISSDMKAIERMANVSNTGPIIAFYSMLAGMGLVGGTVLAGGEGFAGSAGTLATVALGSRGMAKLMTNPKFVRWLANGAKIAKTRPNDMSVHLSRLMVLRFKDDVQDDVNKVVNYILDQK